MAFRRHEPPKKLPSLIASAAQFTFGGAQTWKSLPAGDRGWQQEAWRHYDQCGELRYATGWKGNAASQAVLYAAEIDPATGKPIGPAEDPRVQKAAETVLGGPVKRQQHVRTIAINLDLVGEVYVIVIADAKGDEWIVVSCTELNSNGGRVEYTHPKTGEQRTIGQNDMLIRIWIPHPRLQLNADSAVRAALPTLREIEKSSQNIAARLDSRLAGAGVFIMPSELDFSTGDDEPAEPGGFMGLFARNASAAMADPGSAAAQVPIVVEAPTDQADAFRHLTFETPLSKEVVDLRASGIARLAAALDLPREVIEGMGESNHWSAWQVEESTYKTHLLPLLDVISDALTVAWFTQTLTKMKVADPGRFILAFDGSALIGQPDQTDRVLELYDRGLITEEAVLQELNVPLEYAPAGEERLRAFAQRLVVAAPTLVTDPELRRLLGFRDEPQPLEAAPALPAAPTTDVEEPEAENGPPSRTASAAGFLVASIAVTYALERAGNRLLSTQRLKQEFAHIPKHELHVQLKPDLERHGDLLADAWRHVPMLARTYDLDRYTQALIATGTPHTEANLREWIEVHSVR